MDQNRIKRFEQSQFDRNDSFKIVVTVVDKKQEM